MFLLILSERIEDAEVLRTLTEKRLALRKELTEELHAVRENLLLPNKRQYETFLKSYPNLNRGYRIRHKKDKN